MSQGVLATTPGADGTKEPLGDEPLSGTPAPRVQDVPAFLHALEIALYQDAVDLFELREPTNRTEQLVSPAKASVEFLQSALALVAPETKGADPSNPTLFYFLETLIQERTHVPQPLPKILVPAATDTKQMEWRETAGGLPPIRIPERNAVERAIGNIYSLMPCTAEITPCVKPDAGPIAKAGQKGYALGTGDLKGLVAAFHARCSR